MDRHRVCAALAIASLAVCGCGVRGSGGSIERETGSPIPTPQRIVSLAPSLTETLFALGVGDRVVGVTRYCTHPPEVRELPRVGGHLDPSYEAIVALEPDLVVAIPSSEPSERRLQSLGVRVLRVDQHDVPAILESVTVLAETCGVADRGAVIRRSMERRLDEVAHDVAGETEPRVVVVVGHEIGAGAVRSVWAAGPDTFYDGVLEIAGGRNAVEGGLVRYPELSREGLAALDPDVVVDVVAGVEERGLSLRQIREGWSALTELRAVREGRVRVLEGDVMVVPGPRLPEMVRAVAMALHPNLVGATGG
jgi:iron complex transport system substrate-binding protein